MSDKIEDILLFEIRENRQAIKEIDNRLCRLDKAVFSNKIKLSFFIAGVSIFFNIIIIIVTEKIKSFFT
jgi:hypothetical protein